MPPTDAQVKRHVCEAIKNRHNDEAISMLEAAEAGSPQTERLLWTSLFSAVNNNNASIVQYLLKIGVKPYGEAGRDPFLRAVEKNYISIVQLLLQFGVSVDAADKNGLTALMIAARKGYYHILTVLLRSGADVNTKNNLKGNVLHVLAQDKGCQWGKEIIDALLRARIAINDRDETGRTPLHWAAIMGKEDLCQRLIKGRMDINATEIRGKTSLHLAAARGRDDVVKLLLRYGANVNAKSDGFWTPLHVACEGGHVKTVHNLLDEGAGLNSQLSNGMTPLHIATQAGQLEVVRHLLQQKHIDRSARDSFGLTPLLRAVQTRREDIVMLLSKHHEILDEDAMGSCIGFHATVVDFGNFHNENKVCKRTIYELLYQQDAGDTSKPAFNILPTDSKATSFRWIHIPANNVVWVETLLQKALMERNTQDFIGFIAFDRSFDHQHYGPQTHSHYMRPLCRSQPVAPDIPDAKSKSAKKTGTQSNGEPSPTSSMIFLFMPYLHFETSQRLQEMQTAIRRAESLKHHRDMNADSAAVPIRRATTYDELLLRGYATRKDKGSLHVRRTLDQYLHHNINTKSRKPDQVVNRYQKGHYRKDHDINGDQDTDPKVVMVDQLWMWIVSQDLIVTAFPQRWQQPKNDPLNVLDSIIEDINNKTREPVRSVYDLAASITKCCGATFNRNRSRYPMGQDYQLLDILEVSIGASINEQSNLFDKFNIASAQASQWLQIQRRHDQFSRYLEAEYRMMDQRKRHPSPHNDHSHGTDEETIQDGEPLEHTRLFVDELLEIGSEISLIYKTRCIREDLHIIAKVFEDQRSVLCDLEISLNDMATKLNSVHKQKIKRDFREQLNSLDAHIIEIDRMDKQTERIYKSTTDLLDLKQKHANALEARFARDQSAGIARQRQTMVFTIVTIVFLPLSFMATLFSVNIREFPREPGDSEPALPLSYVSKWMFGIGFGISIPLIIVALSLDFIEDFFRDVKRRLTPRFSRNRTKAEIDDIKLDLSYEVDMHVLEQALDVGSDTPRRRRSFRSF